MNKKITITAYFNRIAFERFDFPEDGNGQDHTAAAAHAYADAATYSLRKAGYAGGTSIKYGNDCRLHGPFISAVIDDCEDENDGLQVDLTDTEKKKAKSDWEAADHAGSEAAYEYCRQANEAFITTGG